MVTLLITLEKIFFCIYNPFLWVTMEIMNRSNNFQVDDEKEWKKSQERDIEDTKDMNVFDWLYYILLPFGLASFLLSYIFKIFFYNLILIPVLKKSTLTKEQQLQFEKIKNRLIFKK